jgi:hypothetical protein
MPLCTRADYKKAFAVVRETINSWDPYNLVGGGAPTDEWESEVASIVAQIPRFFSATDAAHAVSRTFSSAFQHEGFDPESCAGVGSKMYVALVDAGIID